MAVIFSGLASMPLSETKKPNSFPAKCVFGVPAGKLLGFLVSNRGIEANPEKIKAITSLAKPACVNDVQRLAVVLLL